MAELAEALGLALWGDGAVRVARAAAPHEAGPDAIALAGTPVYADALAQGAARAALLWEGADPADYGLDSALIAPRPRHALAGLSAALDQGPDIADGRHPSAQIDPSADIGPGAAIGPFAVIGPDAAIGPGARIGPHVVIGAEVRIGGGSLLHARVTIGARCTIGDRFVAQPGAVVGGDGFSFVTAEPSAAEEVRRTLGEAGGARQQAYARIHSLAAVTIGDDVEIGANSCIDRGTLSDTRLGDGTKIDNLVQVGHNVIVGRHCLLCGQVGVAGSTRIGDRVVLGGQAGVTDHLVIGDDVIAGAGTLLRTNQPAGRVMLGNPAMPMALSVEAYKGLRRLPRLFRDVAALRKHLSNGQGSG
jgi:UDP-3-O-[3-hydroxymyristoyl] glucosamine N-acyltransferase